MGFMIKAFLKDYKRFFATDNCGQPQTNTVKNQGLTTRQSLTVVFPAKVRREKVCVGLWLIQILKQLK
jgi:hypothetical protein